MNGSMSPSVSALTVSGQPSMTARQAPAIAHGILGMLIFVTTEVMFFAGLLSAYSIARSSGVDWPPPGQPRLPEEVTAINTGGLLLSGVLLLLAHRAFSRPDQRSKTRRLLLLSALFGCLFVVVQGSEWVRLIGFGLTLSSSVYGSFFYLIIGTHGLHALAGSVALVWASRQLQSDRLTATALITTQIFWYFVVGIWPLLYFLVYLS